VRDTVAVAEEWVHHALLELTRRKDFVPDSRRLAATLGISVDQVNVALQRLLRLGFLEMQGTRWIVPGAAARDGGAFTRSALVRCHELLGHLIDATEQPSSRLSVI
jgi:DNA-binding transcriptional regulator YhcF (GntR family)